MTDSNKELTTKKLYKTKSITLATFFGGPLAAGYLIGENFNALGERDKGLKSKIIGVIATLILFTTIFSIPEKVMSKVPNSIIPIIYTGLIWFYVEWTQGEFLKKHEENDKSFFSGWRASGIGLICLLIISAGIFSYIYIDSNNPAYDIYDTKISAFSTNEEESLEFYNNIERKGRISLLKELDNKVIPAWEDNIKIINEIKTIEGLPSDLLENNKILLKYSELRLELFTLTRKAINEDTNK